MRHPNILILWTDQQRWDAVGANNPELITPNLDALAAEGVNLDHYFVCNPVCQPSRMSMLTGLYPADLRIYNNGVPLPEDAVTLPRMLRNDGYYSANIGKLHFLNHAGRDHRKRHPDYGFDHLEISDEPGCYEDAYRQWVRLKAPEHLDHISVGLPPATKKWQKVMHIDDGIVHPEDRCPHEAVPFGAPAELTHTAFVGEQTVEFLNRRDGDRPFLCIAGFYSPHSPWVAPQEFLDLYDPDSLTLPNYPEEAEAKRSGEWCSAQQLRSIRHGYYAMCSEVDHHCGRILETLREQGLAEDTIVIFTSDHGEFLGDFLRYQKGYPAPDCISRVPFICRWPAGGASGGQTVDTFAEQVDVIPTLLHWCGIQAPPDLPGRRLPIGEGPETPRDSALTEQQGYKTLRTRRRRYLVDDKGNESLFDMDDPYGEYRNLAERPDHAETLAEMRRLLIQRLLQRERPRERTWCY